MYGIPPPTQGGVGGGRGRPRGGGGHSGGLGGGRWAPPVCGDAIAPGAGGLVGGATVGTPVWWRWWLAAAAPAGRAALPCSSQAAAAALACLLCDTLDDGERNGPGSWGQSGASGRDGVAWATHTRRHCRRRRGASSPRPPGPARCGWVTHVAGEGTRRGGGVGRGGRVAPHPLCPRPWGTGDSRRWRFPPAARERMALPSLTAAAAPSWGLQGDGVPPHPTDPPPPELSRVSLEKSLHLARHLRRQF